MFAALLVLLLLPSSQQLCRPEHQAAASTQDHCCYHCQPLLLLLPLQQQPLHQLGPARCSGSCWVQLLPPLLLQLLPRPRALLQGMRLQPLQSELGLHAAPPVSC
jgi:hypothetical protein